MAWRDNFERLKNEGTVAASPLPTRQLKRMAARALAKQLSLVKSLHDRNTRIAEKRITKKRERAITAARQHDITHGEHRDEICGTGAGHREQE